MGRFLALIVSIATVISVLLSFWLYHQGLRVDAAQFGGIGWIVGVVLFNCFVVFLALAFIKSSRFQKVEKVALLSLLAWMVLLELLIFFSPPSAIPWLHGVGLVVGIGSLYMALTYRAPNV